MVERNIAWLKRNRRLAKDFEKTIACHSMAHYRSCPQNTEKNYSNLFLRQTLRDIDFWLKIVFL
ncbi:hypothetical protein JK174_11940 [Acetobacter thailandicus]|nr:hypothetical protein [Acetobacter thailandicus]MBS0981456.1 hypothetical protein [Acetobacter thailandicus]